MAAATLSALFWALDLAVAPARVAGAARPTATMAPMTTGTRFAGGASMSLLVRAKTLGPVSVVGPGGVVGGVPAAAPGSVEGTLVAGVFPVGGGVVDGPGNGAGTGSGAGAPPPPNFAVAFWPATVVTLCSSLPAFTLCGPGSTSTGSASGAVPTPSPSIVSTEPAAATISMRPSFWRASERPRS